MQKEEIKRNNIVKQYIKWLTMAMLQKKANKYNLNWPENSDHPYRIGGSGSGKTNALLNLIKLQDDDHHSIIDKIYLYVKDPYEVKYQYLLKTWKHGLENLKDPTAFLEYSNDMQDAT